MTSTRTISKSEKLCVGQVVQSPDTSFSTFAQKRLLLSVAETIQMEENEPCPAHSTYNFVLHVFHRHEYNDTLRTIRSHSAGFFGPDIQNKTEFVPRMYHFRGKILCSELIFAGKTLMSKASVARRLGSKRVNPIAFHLMQELPTGAQSLSYKMEVVLKDLERVYVWCAKCESCLKSVIRVGLLIPT